MTGSLTDLAHKVASGQAVTPDEARRLAETSDLVTVGMVATEARRVRVGNGVTYVRVAEIGHDAPLSDKAAPDSTAPGSTAPQGPATDSAPQAAGWPSSAGEIRIVGTPASPEAAIAAVHRIVAAAIGARGAQAESTAAASGSAATASSPAAAGVAPITAFALTDLWTLTGGNARQLERLVRGLKDAGVCGVADVAIDVLPLDDLRQALDIVLTAGLIAPVARWRRTPADPIAAFAALRSLQAATQAFRAVAPLPAQRVAASDLAADPPSTGYDDVKLVAVARVMLDTIEHVQVDWAMYGPKLAQVALLFGASDLDRVSPQDDSPLGHRRAPLEEVQRNITAAFLEPLERDGRFARVGR
jgi:aminodeoxyfutalosine synthase